jgi:hypothetical protein
LRTKRSLFTTFLDDDILIVRDETGVPDIWLRKVVIMFFKRFVFHIVGLESMRPEGLVWLGVQGLGFRA